MFDLTCDQCKWLAGSFTSEGAATSFCEVNGWLEFPRPRRRGYRLFVCARCRRANRRDGEQQELLTLPAVTHTH
jgi:hypothetical protein